MYYIILEIGTWTDDNGEDNYDGKCWGHAITGLIEEYDEVGQGYTPVFKCDALIYADNIFAINDTLGGGITNKVRYMTEPEIAYFKLVCKENNYSIS